MYSLLYMDNGAIITDSLDELEYSYSQLESIFYPYGFEVQQLTTNYLDLQNSINHNSGDVPSEIIWIDVE